MRHPLLEMAKSLRKYLEPTPVLETTTDDQMVELIRQSMLEGMGYFYDKLKKTFENRLGKNWQSAHQKFLKENRYRIAEIVLSNEVKP